MPEREWVANSTHAENDLENSMVHTLSVSQEQEYVFTGIPHIKCGKQTLLTARGQTATRALSTLLLLHNPKSSKKACLENCSMQKTKPTKTTKQKQNTQRKQNHPSGFFGPNSKRRERDARQQRCHYSNFLAWNYQHKKEQFCDVKSCFEESSDQLLSILLGAMQ